MVLTSLLAIDARRREEGRVRKPHKPLTARPPAEAVRDNGRRYSIAQRAQCLSYLALGLPRQRIHEITGIPTWTQTNILKKARERGFDPAVSLQVLEHHVEDGQRSGRPKEIEESTKTAVLTSVASSRAGREQSAEVLAYLNGISGSSVLRILHKEGLSSVKPTRKPGLTKAQQAARLLFCLAHQHWTLEDWKKVIWTDETSVVLGARRGGVRLWRGPHEAVEKTVIRNRWKGFSEFMFWGAFSYDHKGPCHVYKKETVAERRQAAEEVEAWNRDLEEAAKEDWELATAMRRTNLRQRIGGTKPTWQFTVKTGKLASTSLSLFLSF